MLYLSVIHNPIFTHYMHNFNLFSREKRVKFEMLSLFSRHEKWNDFWFHSFREVKVKFKCLEIVRGHSKWKKNWKKWPLSKVDFLASIITTGLVNDDLGHFWPPWPNMGIWAYGHMQKNMAKWSIPEKSIKNAAQPCWPQVQRILHWKVMAKKFFLGIYEIPF